MSTVFGNDYTVLVVGAGGGIGRAVAADLAAHGASVVAADRDQDAARETAAGVEATGGRAIGVALDIADEQSAHQAVATAMAWNGPLSALVNAAGVQGLLGVPSHEVDVASFDAVLRINLTGALVLTRAVFPGFLDRRYGRVVHVASIAGKEGNPNMVAYSASKAGLIGLVKAQGKEYATAGITVNAIAPAVIRTPFLDTQPQEVLDYMTAKIPMGRLGTTAEVASLIRFMVSPECSFTTGFVFDASGGRATY